MEEEEIEPTAEYLAAFNLGYKLNRTSPEIAELVDHLPVQNERLAALKAGICQYREEILEDYTPDWLEADKDTLDPEPDKDIDMDRD